MPALVLAAGRSTRIAAVAAGRPKPLLDVAGRSLLEWSLRWLASHGVGRVWINLHHEADAIRAAIGSGDWLGLDIRYSPESTLLGTAGAWRRLHPAWPSTSLVVYGDNLMRFDLERLLHAHRENGTRMTVALFDPARHAHTAACGGVARVADGRVTAFHEGIGARVDNDQAGVFHEGPHPRQDPAWPSGSLAQRRRAGVGAASEPRTGLINAGVYALEPAVAEVIGEGYQDFGHDVLPRLAEQGWLGAHLIEPTGFCLGVDTPGRYARARAMVAGGVVAL